VTAFVPFTDGAQAELLFTLGARDIENRFWFLNRQPPTTSDQLQALADGIAAWYAAEMLPFLGNDLLFREARVRQWDAPSPGSDFISTVGVLGGSSEKSLSANVTVSVTLHGSTAQTWPDNSSKVVGVPIDQVTGNEYSAAFQDIVFDAYVNLIDAASVFGPFPAWRWMVASSILGGSLRSSLAVARMDFVRFRNRIVSPRRRRVSH
jgi:hypothetical protein